MPKVLFALNVSLFDLNLKQKSWTSTLNILINLIVVYLFIYFFIIIIYLFIYLLFFKTSTFIHKMLIK